MKYLFSRLSSSYGAYLAFLLWGVATFFLLHRVDYGVDEGATRGLLLVWSVVDRIVSPAVTLGFPDFRAIFFIPAGILWTGQVLAARISTIVVVAGAVWGIYEWRQRHGEAEGALLASGLLLISPLLIDQIDRLGTAPYLLASFVLGAWLDQEYRKEPRVFGGLYFMQVFLCFFCTTLHPMGLAYPVTLAWAWHKKPLGEKQQRFFYVGIALAAIAALLLTFGWPTVGWFSNPIRSLADSVLGPSLVDYDLTGIRAAVGSGMLIIVLTILGWQAPSLWGDFLGRVLLIGFIAGLPASDESWAVLTLTVGLYWGLPLLLRMEGGILPAGFFRQRGFALILLIIISTTFMFADKLRYRQLENGLLSSRDELIRTLVDDIDAQTGEQDSENKPAIRVASQWPGRTMLACKCDALPLPPPVDEEQALLIMLRGINYLIFDPTDSRNQSLVRNLAMLSGEATETVALQQAGVIIRLREQVQLPAGKSPVSSPKELEK